MEVLNPYGHVLPPPSRREILRYLRSESATEEIDALIDRTITLAEATASPAVCFTELKLVRRGDTLMFGNIKTNSHDLLRYLERCHSVVVFAATLGAAFERLLQREARRSPAAALVLDAVGDERIEALCDDFCQKLAIRYSGKGYVCRPRFSVGYGDAPLALQREIFALLFCPKSIGVCLTDSLLMSPQKSVTAFVGIQEKETEVNV